MTLTPEADPADKEDPPAQTPPDDKDGAGLGRTSPAQATDGELAASVIGEELDKESGASAGEAETPAGTTAGVAGAAPDKKNVQHSVARSAGIV